MEKWSFHHKDVWLMQALRKFLYPIFSIYKPCFSMHFYNEIFLKQIYFNREMQNKM